MPKPPLWTPPEKEWKLYTFRVYRSSDVYNFIDLLRRSEAMIVSLGCIPTALHHSGYVITYYHTEELYMEVLT